MKVNDFDNVAKWYDRLVRLVFGDQIKRAQTYFLNELPKQGEVLIVGGGTGWILTEILALRPDLEIDYIEASKKMLELSQSKSKGPNIDFIHGTEVDIPSTQYDIIITNFFLDVFAEDRLESVMKVLRHHLKEDGLWFCSDFQKTPRFDHRVLLRLMHFFFRSVSQLESQRLKDFHSYFVKNGLDKRDEQNFYGGMIFSRVYKPT